MQALNGLESRGKNTTRKFDEKPKARPNGQRTVAIGKDGMCEYHGFSSRRCRGLCQQQELAMRDPPTLGLRAGQELSTLPTSCSGRRRTIQSWIIKCRGRRDTPVTNSRGASFAQNGYLVHLTNQADAASKPGSDRHGFSIHPGAGIRLLKCLCRD